MTTDSPKPNGEVRTVSTTGAAKGVKPEAFDLIPSGPLELLAQWYGAGSVNFGETASWEPIFNYVEYHLNRFWLGEDTDPATGLPHLVCGAAGALELLNREVTLQERVTGGYTPLTVHNTALHAPHYSRYDLIPAAPLFALARHYGAGAAKYAAHNWAAGYEWSKPYAAMKRHLWTVRNGEYIDEETGSPHMVAVAWHCLTMVEFYTTHPEFDDRPVRGTQLTNMTKDAAPQADAVLVDPTAVGGQMDKKAPAKKAPAKRSSSHKPLRDARKSSGSSRRR